MQITIRIDDITPDMDWNKFERFKKILDEHNIKPLIGVVPCNKDNKLKRQPERKDYWEYLKDLQSKGWMIAMHGYEHVYVSRNAGIFPLNNKSEFAGLSLAKQDEMIREGKRVLKLNGIITDFFMAPSHSYDRNTLKALRKNGFYRVTDGFGTEPYEMDGIVFYPIAVSRAKALASKEDGIVTFVYHTNTMEDKDFDTFEKLFDRGDVVTYSEFMHHNADMRSTREEISEFLTAKAKYTAVKIKRARK